MNRLGYWMPVLSAWEWFRPGNVRQIVLEKGIKGEKKREIKKSKKRKIGKSENRKMKLTIWKIFINNLVLLAD
jgi:hypothetical protein